MEKGEEELTAVGKTEGGRKKLSHKLIVRLVSLCVLLGLIVLAAVLCIPFINDLRSERGLEALKDRLESYSGAWGIVVFTLIQALQVMIAVVPPIQIVGGLLFGWFYGFLLSFAGILLGTFVIFVMVKKLGRPLVEALVDEKNLKRFKFLQDEKKLISVLMILYLIPGVPKDVLSYIVPLTKVRKREFFLYVMPCRIPAVLMSTVLGSNVSSGNFVAAAVVTGLAVVIAVLGLIFRDRIVDRLSKNKKAEN